MQKIVPCLWFGKEAEQAANFYCSLLPDSRIDRIQKSVMDYPGGPEGSVLVVEFTLMGQPYMGLNGGQLAVPSHLVSFAVACDDQVEVDRLWTGLLADGGKEIQCGWLTDRYGFAWQIFPEILPRYMRDPDKAAATRVMEAMMGMVKIDVAAVEAAYRGG